MDTLVTWPNFLLPPLGTVLGHVVGRTSSLEQPGRAGSGREEAGDFTPSRITDPYDRVTDGYSEHQRPWLTQGTHSRAWLVTAPDADSAAAAKAGRRLDGALQGVVRPLKPTWFQEVEKTGYLILLVPGVIVLALCLLLGAELPATIVATIFATFMIGYPLASSLTGLARGRAARSEAARARPVLDETAPLVRPLPQAGLDALMSAIDNGAPDAELQMLAFQSAGTDVEADRTAARLLELARGHG